ncbi:hypothetical protein F4827_002552 [Paraburkholderia bannensis]|uniref:DUF1376 domain-containing protein n=1 Tax=Paraburkholderia bannensis TaxID=765414 RepID=A0A7W9TYU5_9BURK|nr:MULTISPECIES: hypothetical protein [Paraburkholderia]MBB3257687.1 hypothetical protein [Paraburkholderia sp. WP4_3_2]MBB6102700.1 hypothetical protein [Paraburkholderia bannensis]
MTELPNPLTPPDCDLRNFREMPIDVPRLLGSDLVHDESPEACWSAMLLWCVSWHEVPAGSIPDNDEWLAKRAGYWHKGKLDPTWHEVRDGALHGWIKCNDGRLYHPVLAEKVNASWFSKHRHAHDKLGERMRKRNKARVEKGQLPLEMPDLEAWIEMGRPLERELFPEEFPNLSAGKTTASAGSVVQSQRKSSYLPTETDDCSDGIPLENALNRNEQNGNEMSGVERNLKTIGSNDGSATAPRAREIDGKLTAAGVSMSLIGWERERNKAARGITAANQQVIDLAALSVSADELRKAYEDAVADRLATDDPTPVNAGFVRTFVEKRRRPVVKREDNAWKRSDKGIESKASELGIYPRAGESHDALRERCEAEIRRRAQPQGAAA